MKRTVFAIVCALALSAFAQNTTTFSANEAEYKEWKGLTSDVSFLPNGGPDGKPAIKIESGKERIVYRFISAEPYRGKWVVFSSKVKAENVEKPEKSYCGVKLLVKPGSREGAITRFGTYDWKENATVTFIPENTKRLQLVLGLQETKGTVYYSDLKLTAYPPSADSNFLPTGKVLESMMTNRSGAYLAKGGEDGAEAIRLSNDKKQWNEIVFTIPVDKVRGHKVEFSARMKGEKIDYHQHWGASFKIICRTPNAKPQVFEAKYPHKSDFDWIDMKQGTVIPNDALSVQAVAALYIVKGNVTFSELSFKLDD